MAILRIKPNRYIDAAGALFILVIALLIAGSYFIGAYATETQFKRACEYGLIINIRGTYHACSQLPGDTHGSF